MTQVTPDAGVRPDRVRVVDFNVLQGIPRFEGQEARFQDTLAAFRALRPDVTVLQEAWDTSRPVELVEKFTPVTRHLSHCLFISR